MSAIRRVCRSCTSTASVAGAADGAADTVTPPAFGEWYDRKLPAATLDIVPGAARYVLFTRWADILGTLAATHGA